MIGGRFHDSALQEVLTGTFAQRLGIEVAREGEGETVVALPYRDVNANRSGNLHGGAHASVVLAASKLATASTQRPPYEVRAVVRSLSLSYLAPARNVAVSAAARVTARGREVVHCDVRLDAEDGVTVAQGQVVHVVRPAEGVASNGGPHLGRRASVYGRIDASGGTAVRGSPFLEASKLRSFDHGVDGWQSLLLPVAGNESRPGTIADGAVAGLVDNCGSMAAYTADGLDRSMLGATVAMNVAFGTELDGALVGSGRLIARAGAMLTSAIEIWSPADGRVRADGLIHYRIRGAR